MATIEEDFRKRLLNCNTFILCGDLKVRSMNEDVITASCRPICSNSLRGA